MRVVIAPARMPRSCYYTAAERQGHGKQQNRHEKPSHINSNASGYNAAPLTQRRRVGCMISRNQKFQP